MVVALLASGHTALAAFEPMGGERQVGAPASPARREIAEGLRLMASQQYEAAAKRFEAALATDRGLAEAYWYAAVAYEKLVLGASGARSDDKLTGMQVQIWQVLRAQSCRLYLLTQPPDLISPVARVRCADAMRQVAPSGTSAVLPSDFSEPLSDAQQEELNALLARARRIQVPLNSDGAAIFFLKVNDYMCPPCARTHAEYKPVLEKWQKEYPGKVKVVILDYPLEPECNRFAVTGTHVASCEAAVAVRLAREMGKGAAMEDWLVANHATLTPASVRTAARVAGGVPDFDARYQDTLERVRADIELAAALKDEDGDPLVKGTPTFVINGIVVPGMRAKYLNAVVALEATRAGLRK